MPHVKMKAPIDLFDVPNSPNRELSRIKITKIGSRYSIDILKQATKDIESVIVSFTLTKKQLDNLIFCLSQEL